MFFKKRRQLPPNDFGSLLKFHRRRCGITQDRLGEMLYPPRNKGFISDIESGRKSRALQLFEICELAIAVNVHPRLLLTAYLNEFGAQMGLTPFAPNTFKTEILAKALLVWCVDPYKLEDLLFSPGSVYGPEKIS